MLKVMGLIQRRPDLSLDAFRLHWRTIHRGLALRIAEAGMLKGYVQNHRLDIPLERLAPIADGSPELWFEREEDFDGLRTSPAFREGAFHDEPTFMDTGNYRSLFLHPEDTEKPALPRMAVAGLLKLILLVETPPHGPSGFGARDGAVRISRQRRFGGSSERNLVDFDHVETSWWPDLGSLQEAWARRLVSAPASHKGMLAEERPVFWPGEPVPPADWRPIPQTRQ